ncbi:YfjI family protein [Methylosinus sp. PW1]|uniref:YfjI family protein n=1 Tax=Methylosinus sp. PW1 TaxID=107636 RepID=UPI00068AFA2C|nr:YfjI family protein [Methylosinus sp. PW1]
MIDELADIPFDPAPTAERLPYATSREFEPDPNATQAEGPLPLFPPPPPAAPYPVDALGTLAPVAKAIARKIQAPAAVAAQSVLAVAALAAQAHADVVLPYRQRRPLSLYFATVLGSGDRKSSADAEACAPVSARESFLRAQHRDDLKTWKFAAAAWAAEKRKIEGDKKLGLDERRRKLEALGDEPPKPLAPFLTTGDATLEGLAKNWGSSHPSLGIFSAEGGTFTGGHGMSDDARLRTAAGLNEAWDGRPIKRIRAQDGATILPGRRLSAHVMIQPDAAAAFLGNATLRDVGLLSRFLVAAPDSLAGSRLYRDPAPEDEREISSWTDRVLAILEAPAPMADGATNELAPRALPMSPDAADAWRKFFDHVEKQSGKDGDLAPVRDFASKAAEHAARVAGVFAIFADIRAAEISRADVQNAVRLIDWYLAEAVRLAASSRTDPRLVKADALASWMKAQGRAAYSIRDIMRTGPNQLRPKFEAENAVAILIAHNWLVEISRRPRMFRLAEGV